MAAIPVSSGTVSPVSPTASNPLAPPPLDVEEGGNAPAGKSNDQFDASTTKAVEIPVGQSDEVPDVPSTEAAGSPNVQLIEAEDDGYNDSSYDADSIQDSTMSFTSSIYKYREENGRTYHAYKDGSYPVPNDEAELNRQDMKHHEFTLVLDGKLFTAPLDLSSVHHVLDIGTATGIWAIEFADENPKAQILGVDLSPIQPEFWPVNVMFEVDDIEKPWTYGNKFDYIHCRMMFGSIEDYPKLFGQAMEFLEPGGYLEMMDPTWPMRLNDGEWSKDSSLEKWSRLIGEGLVKIGRDPEAARIYKGQMEAAGFINVTEKSYMVPNNTWPRDRNLKEIGLWQCETMAGATGGMDAVSTAILTRVMGWTKLEVDVLLAFARKEHKDTKIHSYYEFIVVVGQKPPL